jgi:hypothetical protein
MSAGVEKKRGGERPEREPEIGEEALPTRREMPKRDAWQRRGRGHCSLKYLRCLLSRKCVKLLKKKIKRPGYGKSSNRN